MTACSRFFRLFSLVVNIVPLSVWPGPSLHLSSLIVKEGSLSYFATIMGTILICQQLFSCFAQIASRRLSNLAQGDNMYTRNKCDKKVWTKWINELLVFAAFWIWLASVSLSTRLVFLLRQAFYACSTSNSNSNSSIAKAFKIHHVIYCIV